MNVVHINRKRPKHVRQKSTQSLYVNGEIINDHSRERQTYRGRETLC